MKVLYINGASDSGGVTTQQLAKIAPTLQILSVATVEDAVTEIARAGGTACSLRRRPPRMTR